MAVKRTRKLPFQEPRDPAEAAKRLAKLCQQMEDHIDEYKFEPDANRCFLRISSMVCRCCKGAKKAAEALSKP